MCLLEKKINAILISHHTRIHERCIYHIIFLDRHILIHIKLLPHSTTVDGFAPKFKIIPWFFVTIKPSTTNCFMFSIICIMSCRLNTVWVFSKHVSPKKREGTFRHWMKYFFSRISIPRGHVSLEKYFFRKILRGKHILLVLYIQLE